MPNPLAVAVMLCAMAAPLQAGSCALLSSCDVILSNTNVDGLNATVKVTIDNTGAATVLRVEFQSSNLVNTFMGIDEFLYNNATTVKATSGGFANPAKWNFNGDKAGGFGSFASHRNQDLGGTGCGLGSPCSFTLNGLVTTFADTVPQGSEFAAHVQFHTSTGTCSAYVSDGTSTAITDITEAGNYCTARLNAPPLDPVPEPTTMLLVGSLLSGLGVFGRRRLLSIIKG